MTSTIAIGDVHGCLSELKELYQRCIEYEPEQKKKFVFIGDYVDRGPDSKGVIDFVQEISKTHEVIALKGNHEDMLIEAVHQYTYYGRDWHHQYSDTLISFKVNHLLDFPKDYIEWMKERPLYHHDGHRLFVHAGIERQFPLTDQSSQTFLWIRERFLDDPSEDGGFVIHGHTPVTYDPVNRNKLSGKRIVTLQDLQNEMIDQPVLLNNRLNLDTGCVFGGNLTAAIFNDSDVKPIDFIQVKSKTAY